PWQVDPAYRPSLSQGRDRTKTMPARRSVCVTPGTAFVLLPRLVPYPLFVHGTRGMLPDGGQSTFPLLPPARGRGIEKKAIHLDRQCRCSWRTLLSHPALSHLRYQPLAQTEDARANGAYRGVKEPGDVSIGSCQFVRANLLHELFPLAVAFL